MLVDIVKKYYKMGYNCAESIVHAGNEYYGLGLSDHDMKMVAAFGAGIQCGDVCGALLGSACVISSKYIEVKAHDQSVELRKITMKLVLKFQKDMGSRLCAEIKPKFFDREERCLKTVMRAASILEEVIKEWEKDN